MTPKLRVVDANMAAPPYPADTKANGYKLELDWDRIRASKTWRLCPPDQRNNLLRIWTEAWNEYPCGSWEDDDELIAVACDIPVRIFQAHKDQLLRGWILHADGRYYHPVLTEKVLTMIERRSKATERQRRSRAAATEDQALTDDVTRDSTVTNAASRVAYVKEQEQEQEQERSRDTHATHESANPGGPAPRKPCPFSEILKLWRTLGHEVRQPAEVEHWTDARKAQIRARWHNQLPDLDAWQAMVDAVRASNFLMGRVPPTPGRKQFQCDLFWITKPENLLKLMEGRYDG